MRNRVLRLAILLLAACARIGLAHQDAGSIPKSSAPTASALDGKLRAPEGFKITYFAR